MIINSILECESVWFHRWLSLPRRLQHFFHRLKTSNITTFYYCFLNTGESRWSLQFIKSRGAKFSTTRSQFKILGARKVTWITFPNKDPIILGATVHSLVGMAIWPPEFVYPWSTVYIKLYVTENTIHLHYKDQSVSAVYENSACFFWES
jgi:hypothetical protein